MREGSYSLLHKLVHMVMLGILGKHVVCLLVLHVVALSIAPAFDIIVVELALCPEVSIHLCSCRPWLAEEMREGRYSLLLEVLAG